MDDEDFSAYAGVREEASGHRGRGRAAPHGPQHLIQVAAVVLLVLVVVGGSFAVSRELGPPARDLVAGGRTNTGALTATAEVGTDALARSVPARVALPTNRWRPGEPASEALLAGTLVLDGDGCVALDHPPTGSRTYVTWPAGYTATTGTSGQVTLWGPDGEEVAHSADTVEMGGGFHPVAAVDPHPCLPRARAEIFSVQSEVTVLPAPSRAPEVPGSTGAAAGTPALVDAATLPCPAAERAVVALDVPGPGRPAPGEAVDRLLRGGLAVTSVHDDGGRATVIVSDTDGRVVQAYVASRREDGWWPDGFSTC